MGGRLWGALLPAALLLAGCTSSPQARTVETAVSSAATSAAAPVSTASASAATPVTTSTVTPRIDGLITDSDQRGLVAAYIGGGCDGPARLAVTETASRIELDVRIGPDPNGPEPCPAMGYSRTVAARLTRPIGQRLIFSGGHRLLPFDGSRRQIPTALPPKFTPGTQSFGSEPAPDPALPGPTAGTHGSTADAQYATTRWTLVYGQPQPPGNHCTPTRGLLQITVGPTDADFFASGWTRTVAASIAGHPTRLWREGPPKAPTSWAYSWTADQGSVEVLAQTGCRGDRILDPTELLEVAQFLKSP